MDEGKGCMGEREEWEALQYLNAYSTYLQSAQFEVLCKYFALKIPSSLSSWENTKIIQKS